MKHLKTPLGKARLAKGMPVMADKGYAPAENRGVLSRMKLKSRIMHKAQKPPPLTLARSSGI